MSRNRVSYKWILLGAGIIFGLNLSMKILLAEPVRTNLVTQFNGMTGVYVFVGIVAFVSFFVGGALIGMFSPGETLKEPAIAAAIAAGLNCIENFRNVDERSFTTGQWLVGSLVSLGVGFVMALGGAWVGERLQGDTPEKHREAEEPPSRAE